MARKLLDKIQSGNKVAKTYRDTETGEYIVRLLVDGKLVADADYFADDLQDAYGTASLMVNAIDVELPTAVDLAAYDEADLLATSKMVMHLLNDGVTADLEETVTLHDFRQAKPVAKAVTQWRLTIHVNGKDVEGHWQAWNEHQYMSITKVCAKLHAGYSVEFK